MEKFSPQYFELHLRDERWQHAAEVPNADPASYRPLNHCWFVDQSYVYFEGRRLRHADVASFAALNEMFARDRNKAYSKYGDAGCVEDVASFEALDEGFFMEAGLPSYGGYARDRGAVYFAEFMSSAPMKVRGADPKTFTSLGRLYATDGGAAYHAGKAIPGATPERFEVLDTHHARDARRVYYLGRPIAQAVPDEFEVIAEYHGRDRRHVYDRGGIIPGADPATYEFLDGIYVSRDRTQVFVCSRAQPHIDIASFEFLGYDYFADRNGVYWQGKRIAGAERASFRAERYGSAADSGGAYYKDVRQKKRQEPPADFATWEHSFKRRMFWAVPRIVWQAFKLGVPLLFKGLLARRGERGARAAPAREADVLLLAETLAMGDAEAVAPVRLALEDPAAFIETYGAREEFADEPSWAWILEEVEEPQQLSAFRVLQEVYHTRGLLGIIDWRSEDHVTIDQVEPMLRRLGIRDFDWSFTERLGEEGDGTELRNNNFLSLLGDRLRPLGLTLANVNTFGDNYGFAVLRSEDFAKIDGMVDSEQFAISDDFGPDEGYARGKRLLEAVVGGGD